MTDRLTGENQQTKTERTAGKAFDKLTSANEDYLEAILELGAKSGGSVRSVDLAAKMGVSKASVNRALTHLKQAGLVEQPYYGDITLTPEGISYGESVLERHQVLFQFLVDVLGVEPEVAAGEACVMEHAISDGTLKCLIAHLKDQMDLS